MLLTTKLKLATILPASAMLFACANGPMQAQPTHPTTTPTAHVSPSMMTNAYTCDDDSNIYAEYTPNGEQAMLSATVPQVKWVNQPLTLNIAQSASGMRYVNAASPNVTHQWQAKGNDAILTINWTTGEEYSIVCQRAN